MNSLSGAVNKWENNGTPIGAVYLGAIQVFKKTLNRIMLYGGEAFDHIHTGLLKPFPTTVVSLE